MNKNTKKGFLVGVVALALAIGGTLNIRHATQEKQIADLSMANVEAYANLFDYLSEWWESKTHTCVSESCSAIVSTEWKVTVDVWGNSSYSWVNTYGPGTKLDCVSGEEYAHCSDCETDCVPDA